jgi:hypothetical protein
MKKTRIQAIVDSVLKEAEKTEKDVLLKNVILKIPAFIIKADVIVSDRTYDGVQKVEIEIDDFDNNIEEVLDALVPEILAKAVMPYLAKKGIKIDMKSTDIGSHSAVFPMDATFDKK